MTADHLLPDPKLAEEFMANPLGRHSPPLQYLLRRFRSTPLAGWPALYCVRPGREWILAELGEGKATSPRIHWDRRFQNIADGERYVFALRWQRFFGVPLQWGTSR